MFHNVREKVLEHVVFYEGFVPVDTPTYNMRSFPR